MDIGVVNSIRDRNFDQLKVESLESLKEEKHYQKGYRLTKNKDK